MHYNVLIYWKPLDVPVAYVTGLRRVGPIYENPGVSHTDGVHVGQWKILKIVAIFVEYMKSSAAGR